MAVNVPAAYRGWVDTAAKATGLPAPIVAAQINMESGFNPRATSPVGAQGIAQFMPGTWRSQGVAGSPYDPNAALQGYSKLMGSLLRQYGGNVKNALAAYNAGPGNLGAGMGYASSILSSAGQSPTARAGTAGQVASGPTFASTGPSVQFDQAAFDRAKQAAIAGQYLAQSAKSAGLWSTGPKSTIDTGASGLIGPGLLTTKTPNKADYTTATAAQTSLQQLAGPTNLNVHPGSLPAGSGDVNPLAHGWTIGRTDQGVDANAAPGTPILAVNDSVVKEIVPNWYSGQPLVLLQLTSGPNAGKYWYVSEQIAGVPRVGQQIARGQIVARYASQGTGIEIGWGSPSSAGRTLAQAQGPLPAGHADTAAGQSFRQQILHA